METLNPRKYVTQKKKITVTEEFLNAVDEYVLTATNEGEFYKGVQEWFAITYNKELTPGFPVAYGLKDLIPLMNKIKKSDFGMDIPSTNKTAFVQTMLYLHYIADFVSKYADMRITDFYEITVQVPVKELNLTEEIDQHLANAEQHFKIVENKMNTLSKFEKEVSATVHLIHGRPADDYSESELMQLIREAQKNKAAIADLVETSERMKTKSAKYDADIAVYVEALDKLQ